MGRARGVPQTHVRRVGALSRSAPRPGAPYPWDPCQKLVPDAEKEEKDDQPERHAEQPEQDQDHLGSSLNRVVRSLASVREDSERVR